jgi:sugar lactone lactonase YvrE
MTRLRLALLAAPLVLGAAIAGRLLRRPRCASLCVAPRLVRLDRIAGHPGGVGHVDGPLGTAHLLAPWGIVSDGDSTLYVGEDGGKTIRAVDLRAQRVTTLAGAAGRFGTHDGIGPEAEFGGPSGLALREGRLYIADPETHRLRVLDLSTRRVTTLTGTADPGFRDGALAEAQWNEPEGVAFVGDRLYVADTDNHVIRRIDLGVGRVETVAGATLQAGDMDGPGRTARFKKPMQLAPDDEGHLYVCDTGNRAIRTIRVSDGSITTLARLEAIPNGLLVVGPELFVTQNDHRVVRIDRASGSVRPWLGAAEQVGYEEGAGESARFTVPGGLCLHGSKTLFVADGGNHVLREVDLASGVVRTRVGARSWGATDGDRDAARFHGPLGLAWDRRGAYFVADTENHTIRRVDARTGRVVTIAGAAGQRGAQDGVGSSARFSAPEFLALGGGDRLYVADTGNRRIRRVDLATGAVSTVALQGPSPLSPAGIVALDGSLFVVDREGHVVLRVEEASGASAIIAGQRLASGKSDGIGDRARFFLPRGLATDGRDHLYVADTYNHTIRAIDLHTFMVSTLPGGPYPLAAHVAANGVGDLFVVAVTDPVIRHVEPATGRALTGIGTAGRLGVLEGPLPTQIGQATALALDDRGGLAFFSENTLLLAHD